MTPSTAKMAGRQLSWLDRGAELLLALKVAVALGGRGKERPGQNTLVSRLVSVLWTVHLRELLLTLQHRGRRYGRVPESRSKIPLLCSR